MDQHPVAPLEFEAFPPALRDRLAPRIDRLGYLGAFFSHMAHQPRALGAFIDFTESLKGALAPDLVEVVALTVATKLGNDYERHQHEQLCLVLGFSPDWIAAVESCSPSGSSVLTTGQAAVQDLVLAAIDRHGSDVQGQLARVVAQLGQEDAVGVLFLLSRYVAHAVISNSLDLVPPVPSIFLENGDGSDA